jgi:hypothetical protein
MDDTKRLTIGVTVHLHAAPGTGIWSAGSTQNCVFLVTAMRACPNVGRVLLINCGDAKTPPAAYMLGVCSDLEIVNFSTEILDSLDVLIECGSQVSAENVARVRARGGRAVAYRFGNNWALDTERMLRGPIAKQLTDILAPEALAALKPILQAKDGGGMINKAVFDEVWVIPQHAETCRAYFEITLRAPVRVVPHIWESTFVDAAVAEFSKDPATAGLTFGYQPGRPKKRVSIFEPNLNIIKQCISALLVAEAGYRRRSDLFEHVWCTNALDLIKLPMFESFVWALDLQNHRGADGNPVVTFDGRYNLPFWLAKSTDVMLTWTWENDLNYSFYDALYGGYPLVHSSTLLPDGVGYRYHGFDAQDGGNVLVSAMLNHDSQHEAYKARADAFLATVRGAHRSNVEAHTRALRLLYGAD